MKKLSLLLALILCFSAVGCDKAGDGGTEAVTENMTESVTEAPNEQTEPTEAPVKAMTADEAWDTLSDALTQRDGRYEYACESTTEKVVDGVECYEMHVRTHSTQSFYDKNGDG